MTQATKVATNLVRKDPAKRHTDGQRGRSFLLGADPDRKYVFASRAEASGEQYYLSLGYEHVMQPKADDRTSVRLKRGTNSKPGEPIEESGHVLMSIDAATAHEYFQHGDEECGGQDWVDALEKRIVDPEGEFDGMRGLSDSRYAPILSNKITPLQAE